MAKPKKYRLTITAVVTVEEIAPHEDETRPELAELTTRPATWFPEETTRRRKPKAEKRQRAR